MGLGGEDGVMSAGMSAEDDLGAGRGFDAESLGGDGDAAIVSDLDEGALAPDEGPPGTARDGTEDGAFFFSGGVPSLLGFHLEFAVDLMLVAMERGKEWRGKNGFCALD